VQALRELQPLLQSPQVGMAAKAALIHAKGVAEDHDKEVAVLKMAAELDVSLPCLVHMQTYLQMTSFYVSNTASH